MSWKAETLVRDLRYRAVTPLVTPEEAKEIESRMCQTPITPERAKELFLQVRTFDELREFMTCVVLNKMPSPIYDFESVDEPNTDNGWWGDDAWTMLVAMNVRGLVTHESEDNGPPQTEEAIAYQRKNKIMARASVSGVMRRNQATFDLVREVNYEGMIAYVYPFEANNVHRAIGELTVRPKIPRTYVNDRPIASLPTALPVDAFMPFQIPGIEDLLLTDCVAVEFMDPNFGVPASKSLFPIILKHLPPVSSGQGASTPP